MKDELKDMTADQLEQLLEQKRAEERQAADKRRRDYEETRADFVKRMAAETRNITGRVREFYDLVVAETDAFRKIMQEYGATRRDDQLGYSVQEGDFSEIMQLFKESNVVNGTAINFYFHQRDERGVWHRIEPSFNRM